MADLANQLVSCCFLNRAMLIGILNAICHLSFSFLHRIQGTFGPADLDIFGYYVLIYMMKPLAALWPWRQWLLDRQNEDEYLWMGCRLEWARCELQRAFVRRRGPRRSRSAVLTADSRADGEGEHPQRAIVMLRRGPWPRRQWNWPPSHACATAGLISLLSSVTPVTNGPRK